MVTEVNEETNDDEPQQGGDGADCSEDELQKRKTTNVFSWSGGGESVSG